MDIKTPRAEAEKEWEQSFRMELSPFRHISSNIILNFN